MPNGLNVDLLAAEVARLIFQSGARTPFLFLANQTATDVSGNVYHLQSFAQHPNAREIVLVTIALSPTSSAGSWRSDGPHIVGASDGLFLAAGGGYLYLYSIDEVRNFRMRANAAGTITWSAQAHRLAGAR